MRMKFYLEGPHRKGTAQLEAKKVSKIHQTHLTNDQLYKFSLFVSPSARSLQRSFHFSLSVAHSFEASMSLLTVSLRLNLGLPLGRFPSIFISATARMFSVSCLLYTCPKHSKLLLFMIFAIGCTNMSFLRCSSRLTLLCKCMPLSV